MASHPSQIGFSPPVPRTPTAHAAAAAAAAAAAEAAELEAHAAAAVAAAAAAADAGFSEQLAARDDRIAALEAQLGAVRGRGIGREVELINQEYVKVLGKLDVAEAARTAAELRSGRLEAALAAGAERGASAQELAAAQTLLEHERLRASELERQLELREAELSQQGQKRILLEGDLRDQVRQQSVAVLKLEAELGGNLGVIQEQRTAALGAETRLRVVEKDAEARYIETHHTVEHMRRGLRAAEREAAVLRETLAQRDDEVRALQMSNAEWLRKFRRQKESLATKTIEADYLRSVDTPAVALAQLDVTPAQASNIRDALRTPRSDRIRSVNRSHAGQPSSAPAVGSVFPSHSSVLPPAVSLPAYASVASLPLSSSHLDASLHSVLKSHHA